MENIKSNQTKPQNKMGVMPINKLLISMSAPMMVSMLIQALYNVVDSIFVSHITNDGLPFSALNLSFPIQSLMIAVSVGTGVGVNALLSRKLGAKDYDGANELARTGVFLAFCSYLLFLIAGIFVVRPFFEMQTDNVQIIEYGVQYLTICMVGSFGLFFQIMYERLMQSTGKTIYVMFTQGTGALINIIFDPIFIFGCKMGVVGAALATILGQIVAMCLAIFIHHKLNKEVSVDYKKVFTPGLKTVGAIYAVALPSIVMQSIGSIMVFLLNKILLTFDEMATNVFGAYFKLQSFVFMPVLGLNNGMVPIISFNYGARNKQRIVKTVKLAVVYALAIMTVGMLLIQIFPKQLLLLFNADAMLIERGTVALRIISTHFVLAAVCIVFSSVFQAMGKAVRSMIVSVCRQLVVLVPVAFLFSLTRNVNNVWWAFPAAEVVSLAMCVGFYLNIYNKIIKKI